MECYVFVNARVLPTKQSSRAFHAHEDTQYISLMNRNGAQTLQESVSLLWFFLRSVLFQIASHWKSRIYYKMAIDDCFLFASWVPIFQAIVSFRLAFDWSRRKALMSKWFKWARFSTLIATERENNEMMKYAAAKRSAHRFPLICAHSFNKSIQSTINQRTN